jgi:hypothetical protein
MTMRLLADGRNGLALLRALRRLRREEDGSMIVFSLFLIILMLMVGGMAVDIMRHESMRARLQGTLDRAVLAAADLDQTLPPRNVVEDYFEKAGLLQDITSITVTERMNFRRVAATAEAEMDTFFMDMLGVEDLIAPAGGEAVESISDIEIMLVLDITGSMNEATGSTTKIAALRLAARDFVRAMLENDDQNRISIGIIPFAAQVNLGQALFNQYMVSYRHDLPNSYCLDLPSSVFGSGPVPRLLAIPQSGYFDVTSGTSQQQNYNYFTNTTNGTVQAPSLGSFTCQLGTNNMVVLPTRNQSTLESRIAGLTANGTTSITLGMRWGLSMLDPSNRSMYSSLISAGQIPSHLAGRPYDYRQSGTMKVIVLMTDGEHVASPFLRDNYRTQISPIYMTTAAPATVTNPIFSIYHDRPSTNLDYWVPYLDPDNNLSDGREGNWVAAPYNGTAGNATTLTQLYWHEVWQRMQMQYVAWNFYARALGTNSSTRNSTFGIWIQNFRNTTNAANMDSTLQQSCTFARNNGVIVFGIAFEAPSNGQTQIRNCATSPSYAYNATGLQIISVFQDIATQINQLRLVQ